MAQFAPMVTFREAIKPKRNGRDKIVQARDVGPDGRLRVTDIASIAAASADGSPMPASTRASWERSRSKAEKLRAKLGQPGFITPHDIHRFPEKPPRMRWTTYERLRSKDARLMRGSRTGDRMVLAKRRR
jgi:hypothetical protein